MRDTSPVSGSIIGIRPVLALAAALVVVGVGGCGVGAGDPEKSDGATKSPDPPRPGQVAAPDDLDDFVCVQNSSGTWSASGTLTNATRKPVDYRVTVVVTEGEEGPAKARRQVVTGVAPDSPTAFRIERVPAAATATATCRVQVLRLRPDSNRAATPSR